MPNGVIAIVIGSLVREKPNVFLFAFRKLGAQRQIRTFGPFELQMNSHCMHSRLPTVEKWDMLKMPYMLLTLVRVYAL